MSDEPHKEASDTPPTETEVEDQEERGGLPSWAKIGLVFSVLAGGVAFLLLGSGADEAFVYSKLVDEVMEEPAAYADRKLRVEGDLRQGSVKFREDPCEWRFVLHKEGHEMPVQFPQCVVPDTFRDDMGISVVVEGELKGDGTFLASQVIPRCPSKYEMKEKLESGEKAPHSMPASTSAAPESGAGNAPLGG
jgi:cytochrome c-type biogenesis protein CcmE